MEITGEKGLRHQKNPTTNPMGRGAGVPCLDAGSRSKLTCPTFLRSGRPLSSCPHHVTPEVSTGSLGADQAGPPSLRRGAPFPFEVRNGNTIHLGLTTLSGDPSSLTSPKVAVLYGSMTNLQSEPPPNIRKIVFFRASSSFQIS